MYIFVGQAATCKLSEENMTTNYTYLFAAYCYNNAFANELLIVWSKCYPWTTNNLTHLGNELDPKVIAIQFKIYRHIKNITLIAIFWNSMKSVYFSRNCSYTHFLKRECGLECLHVLGVLDN